MDNQNENKCQIIREDYTFNDGIGSSFENWGLKDLGFDYHVMAIIGCQSSGKSTLLNLLFNTSFQEMDADVGRGQTTKGLWIARAPETNVLVMDVEGNDSKERGEDVNFERKSALFSLAVSEVLLVNMWCADIGRYAAANYGLLKIVFDIHLQLFQHDASQKTLLLFVLRDHTQRTPLECFRKQLIDDMVKLWDDLEKPAQFKQTPIETFFDFEFVSLPHKDFQVDEFHAGIASLRNMLVHSENERYAFRDAYHRKIHADDFPVFASDIWKTVRQNKDLDLPTQKEMLALYRCDELCDTAVRVFDDSVASLSLSTTMASDFTRLAESMVSDALGVYDVPAERYHATVREQKREDLLQRLATGSLLSTFRVRLGSLAAEAKKAFISDLRDQLSSSAEAVKNFSLVLDTVTRESLAHFSSCGSELFVSSLTAVSSSWNDAIDAHMQKLTEDFADEGKLRREALVGELIKMTDERFYESMGSSVQAMVDEADVNDMWFGLSNVVDSTFNGVLKFVQEASSPDGLNASDNEVHEWSISAAHSASFVVHKAVREASLYLPIKMLKRFERAFKIDENGVPRDWVRGVDVAGIFTRAKEEGLALVPLFSNLQLSGTVAKIIVNDGLKKETDILSANQIKDFRERYENETTPIFREAVDRQRINSTDNSLPPWIFIVLFVLGFNEGVAILTSPVLLVLCCFLGAVCYVGYNLGFAGPAVNVTKTLLHGIVSGAQRALDTQMGPHSVDPSNGNGNLNGTDKLKSQ